MGGPGLFSNGFADPKYISRLFSEEFGISPRNYRLSAGGGTIVHLFGTIVHLFYIWGAVVLWGCFVATNPLSVQPMYLLSTSSGSAQRTPRFSLRSAIIPDGRRIHKIPSSGGYQSSSHSWWIALFAWLVLGNLSGMAQSPAPVTFSYNGTNGSDGSAQTYTVPSGVFSLSVVAFGAKGRDGCLSLWRPRGQGRSPFDGDPRPDADDHGRRDSQTPSGGYNGGGSGIGSTAFRGGGGGGATDIRLNGNDLTNRVIVAGGGGGGSPSPEEETCWWSGGWPYGWSGSWTCARGRWHPIWMVAQADQERLQMGNRAPWPLAEMDSWKSEVRYWRWWWWVLWRG